ncbi:acidic mammalian chitinase-like [Brachionus plicatilis]|uniref:Acidic mammalian chitinase-like n=1 Tax=Brachionus plicatilis TaxID=10195 RepID=A0A3M7QBS4_BRAPC|nr:acidic mammalian chitinase-like [Brachionus plicatilis]
MRLALGLILLFLGSGLSDGISIDWDLDGNEKDQSYKIVCYYTNWAQYRPKPASYFPEDIDPHLCTHIIFAFAKINDQSELEAFEWNDESTEWAPGMYKRTIDLKKKNKNLKILIAVGGWNHGSLLFSNMVSDEFKRKNFITKTVEFLTKNEFDGFDLDWEYPANRDTEDRPDDKIYFTILCKELKAAFKPHNLILTAAVAAGEKYIRSAYELDEIHKYLDFINIMAYDMHGGWDNVTGHNAPLYAHQFDRDPGLNVDFAVKLWLEHVPANKLVLGLSAYGRSFKLKEGFESCPLTDTPVISGGSDGKYSREAGFLTYFETCEKILKNDWKYIWNEEQKVPFAYSNEITTSSAAPIEWVGFDDVKSIEVKVEYIIKHKLGGGMLWSLDMDDFTGTFCNQGKYPILTTVNVLLNPKLKRPMPDAKILWNTENAKLSNPDEPIQESSLFINDTEKKLSSTGFYSSNNVFGLIQNKVLQVYKFCECKNGTHKISTDGDKFSYTVDCNIKQVFQDGEGKTVTKSPDGPNATPKITGTGSENKNNIWAIFNINSASTVSDNALMPNLFYYPNYNGLVEEQSRFKIVCYLNSLFRSRENLAQIRFEDLVLAAESCTHFIFSSAKICPDEYDKIVPRNSHDTDLYQLVTELKNVNPTIKVLISVGSYKDGTMPIIKMTESFLNRKNFIRNSILFLKKYNFDGLELNWNLRNIDSNNDYIKSNILILKKQFSKLASQIKRAFVPFNFLLSAMVSGINEVAQDSYEIKQISGYFDFVTLMNYDFYEIPLILKYGVHHNPLYSTDTQISVDSSVNFWLKNGFPKEKLLIGVESYARTYTLYANRVNDLGSSILDYGEPGVFTSLPGVLSFYEVCDNLYSKNWLRSWILSEMVPMASNRNDQIVFYEDLESVSFKSNYVKEKNLGGISLFSLDNDDFTGIFCMQGKFPLLETIREALNY